LLTTATADREQTRSIPPEQHATLQEGAIAGSDVDQAEPGAVTPAITAYLNSVDPYKRAAAVAELARSRPHDAFSLITNCFDDHSPHVRNSAARALRKLDPARTVDLFNRALEEASAERRRNIGGAIAASGVATEAIENLIGENREDTYSALSILFVMAKSGEVEPLVRALEAHPDDEIGKAVAKLLALSGHR
jgi:HEAT repeat protein